MLLSGNSCVICKYLAAPILVPHNASLGGAAPRRRLAEPRPGSLAQGQINLRDAVRHECSFVDPKSGKKYQLGPKLATLLVRAGLFEVIG